jgi:hypothetical protein
MRRIMVLVTVALVMAERHQRLARFGSELGEPASWASHREREP